VMPLRGDGGGVPGRRLAGHRLRRRPANPMTRHSSPIPLHGFAVEQASGGPASLGGGLSAGDVSVRSRSSTVAGRCMCAPDRQPSAVLRRRSRDSAMQAAGRETTSAEGMRPPRRCSHNTRLAKIMPAHAGPTGARPKPHRSKASRACSTGRMPGRSGVPCGVLCAKRTSAAKSSGRAQNSAGHPRPPDRVRLRQDIRPHPRHQCHIALNDRDGGVAVRTTTN